jgi:hypothetical protein
MEGFAQNICLLPPPHIPPEYPKVPVSTPGLCHTLDVSGGVAGASYSVTLRVMCGGS